MAAKDLYEKDFYKTLGVDKKAGADEIKKKYRALARDLHPDKTKGDAAKEDKFKAVSEAYEILSDEKKRAEYDEARALYERGGFRPPQGGPGADFSDMFGGGNPQDIFANLFGGGARRGPRRPPPNKLAKISCGFPPPKMSPKSPPWKFCPPVGARKPPRSNNERASSYSDFFFVSDKMSYASETALNSSSRLASPLVLSGCNSRAKERYFFFISSGVADLDTPRIL